MSDRKAVISQEKEDFIIHECEAKTAERLHFTEIFEIIATSWSSKQSDEIWRSTKTAQFKFKSTFSSQNFSVKRA